MKTLLRSSYGAFCSLKRDVRDYLFWRQYNRHPNIHVLNYWRDQPLEHLWLYRFMKAHNLLPSRDLLLISSLGSRRLANVFGGGQSIFFVGENVHYGVFSQYADLMLTDPRTKLALGFDYFEDERYLRFPLWILYHFSPEADEKEIRETCQRLRYPMDTEDRDRFATMIASHDVDDIRKRITNTLDSISTVSCAGKLLHNDDSLWKQYKDNKSAYMRSFRYNICPENSNAMGYVTEKLFQSIQAGCIPIYWGSYNQPEPNIINPQAVLFFDTQSTNEPLTQIICSLENNPQMYKEMANLPRLLPTAEECIMNMFSSLEQKIKQAIE